MKPAQAARPPSRPPRIKPDGEAGLARRRARGELRERDEVDIGALAQPAPALDEFGAKIAEMGDRPAERSQPEPEEDEEDFARRSPLRPSPGLTRDVCFGAQGFGADAFGKRRFASSMDPLAFQSAGFRPRQTAVGAAMYSRRRPRLKLERRNPREAARVTGDVEL